MDNHKATTTPHHNPTTNNRSMSDTDSQFDEYYSPLHEIPTSPSKAMVIVTNHHTTTTSPPSHHHQIPPQTLPLPPPLATAYNQTAREEPVTGHAKVNSGGGGEDGRGGGGGGGGERARGGKGGGGGVVVVIDRVALGFRVLEVVLSLIAFSVMASDKTQGWSGDSFDRYKEYRYVVAVNAIAFAYATFQAIDMTYRLSSGKHLISYSLRPLFDFIIDQALAYLLISASSSAATRVDDWVSNWGKDDFTEMATASIGMSFLAFFAFALSSLISGYNLCNRKSL